MTGQTIGKNNIRRTSVDPLSAYPQNRHPHTPTRATEQTHTRCVTVYVSVSGCVLCVFWTRLSVNQSITSLSAIDRQTLTKTLLRRSLHLLITITRLSRCLITRWSGCETNHRRRSVLTHTTLSLPHTRTHTQRGHTTLPNNPPPNPRSIAPSWRMPCHARNPAMGPRRVTSPLKSVQPLRRLLAISGYDTDNHRSAGLLSPRPNVHSQAPSSSLALASIGAVQ